MIYLLLAYIASVIVTIKNYRDVTKNHKELSYWHNPHWENLLWMLVPIVGLAFLIEALEVKWVAKVLKKRDGDD